MASIVSAVGVRDPSEREANRALLIVSLAVMLSTSVWFSGTAAASTLQELWQLSSLEMSWLTISVQLGFILGTFIYSFLNLPDLFNSRSIFFLSAASGAFFNLAFAGLSDSLSSALVFRLLTGITLAGIYPVAMKIVASWFRVGLGWRLGVLIGALTFGKASSYLLQTLSAVLGWRVLVGMTSLATLIGGAIVLFLLAAGPFLKQRAVFDYRMLFQVFRSRPFRYTAFGYFGHMWELYAFWSLIGFYLSASLSTDRIVTSALSFLALATGGVGCIVAGRLSRRWGERKVALACLVGSGACCLLSGPLSFLPRFAVVGFLVVWGMLVVADSAQFSALATRYCPPQYTGTALTVQNGIGFGITIPSIELLTALAGPMSWQWAFMTLAIGPAVGALFLLRLGTLQGAERVQ